ncbi:hypothetical protein ACFW4K_09055 [Nocardiopsis alba]|uniref:hypothetical protein n=1 Tax=Nocardiopsis alba TaxID=53437 RepID=UPI00366F2FBD
MSNPTITTKLMSLVKGIFGRKETVVEAEPEKKDETPVTETAPETVDAPAEEKAEEKTPAPAEEKAPTEEPAEKTPASAAEKPVEEPAAPVVSEETSEKTAEAETATLVEEPKDEPSAPATDDLPEDGRELAEELAAAEAHTTVADDEVLEKVRKEAAPAAEDLAVPTYDELTLPSIRARLRKLTIEQVRDLRAYEVAHQGRPEFIKMYDNRITKLQNEEK